MKQVVSILITLLLLTPSAPGAERAGSCVALNDMGISAQTILGKVVFPGENILLDENYILPDSGTENPRVAVIDTGISTRAIAGRDNILPGENYILPDSGIEDLQGHGTAVAGIIVGSSSAKVEGLCPEAELVPLVWSTLDGEGNPIQGDAETAALAIRDAIDVYECRIINLSMGTYTDSPALREAVAYAEEKGVLLVAAAGNGGDDRPCYPGAYESVLCVGSVDEEGEVSSFSPQGSWLDLTAPGEGLRVVSLRGRTIRVWGTSYSAAYVTGAAARLLAENPSLTAADLRDLLTASARDLSEPGFDEASGWGALDLKAALKLQEEYKQNKSQMPLTQKK